MEKKKPKKLKKRLGLALFIAFNVAVIGATAYVDFGERGAQDNGKLHMDLLMFLAVVGCFLAALLSDSAKYELMLRHTTGRRMPKTAFRVAALGKYYDNITPFGAGGQPFQGMYLLKQGVPAGTAAAIPVAGFLSTQIAFILIGLAVLIFGGGVMKVVPIRVAAFVGLGFYIFVPAAIVFFALMPKFAEKVIRFFVRLMGKLHLVKNPAATEAKSLATLSSAKDSITSIYHGKHLFVRMLLLSLVYQAAICCMPYFILHGFGNDLPFLQVFCTTVFIYLCITFVPTPGNSGVAEGSFYALFAVLGQGNLFWAMLVWRFFCYYLFTATGLGVVLHGAIKERRRR